MNKHVISTDEVLARTALSKSMLYKLVRQEKFPHPVPMSNRSIGWFEVDIENWLKTKQAFRHSHLPLIYITGKMDRKQGGDISCWRIFDSSQHMVLDESGVEDIQIAPPQEMVFHGTQTRFMYSGPWSAYNDYVRGSTAESIDGARNTAYRGAIQGISRADVVLAYLEDSLVYGSLVEIGYARAASKRVIVITSPALHKPPLDEIWDSGLWVAVRAADRHIELPYHPGHTSEDYRCLAYVHAAKIIAEWYPNTSIRSS
ncbi:MAG: AlpA family phage regulatory protein [Comamonas sp.]|uniref:AlpA family phage regulatory protein n=1 Tax=Comamonas sp. TaxID=34028 RepID=UPI00284D3039|nr:AlpA family phage regulatory protein [Comamonas sp.]MDR3066358.1 AlpA family phage regulatory protein [Comamonas sp.]